MSTRLHYQICDQKGLAYSVAGSLHSYHDARAARGRRRLLAREAAGAGDARRWRCSGGSATSWSARTSWRRPSGVSSATSSRRTTTSTGCAAGSAAPSSTRGGSAGEARARAGARAAGAIRDVARRVLRPERLSVTVVGALSPTLSRRVEKIVKGFSTGPSQVPHLPRRAPRGEAALRWTRSPEATCASASSSSWRATARGGRRDLDGERERLLDRLARLLLTEHEARLGVDRLLAGLGRRDRDVEARRLLRALREIGARQLRLLHRHARGRRQRDGDRRLGVDVPAGLRGDRQARGRGRADGDLGLRLLDLVERVAGAEGAPAARDEGDAAKWKRGTGESTHGLRVAGRLSPRHR